MTSNKAKEIDDNFFTLFETYLLAEKRVAKNTFLAYKKDLDQLKIFFKKNKISLKKCTKNHLKKFLRFLNGNNITAKTLSRKISSIKALFKFLSERFNFQNKTSSLVFPKIEKRLPVYLSEDEVQNLIKIASKDVSSKGIRNRIMLCLLYASGMRVSELVNLKIDQIHFDTGFVSLVGKGNKERLVPLPENILNFLKYYLNEVYPKLKPKSEFNKENKNENFLFFSFYKGKLKSISRQSFWLILKKILLIAGIKKSVSPHTLRHSLATHLLKSGANIRSLQLLLGHEQISTVQVYTHLEKSHLRDVYDDKHPRA